MSDPSLAAAPPAAAAAADGGAQPASASSVSSGDRSFDRDLFDQVELVYQRVTRGRHDLKRLKAYMDARAEMARAWSKSLLKASVASELEDSSSLGGVWKEVLETGAAQAKQQESFAASCAEISAALEGQINEVKKSKTSLHASWTKLVADVKKKQLAHDKCKSSYYESVKQAETAVMNRDAAHEQKMPDKAVQKAETRAKQCLKEVDQLHAQYQAAVAALAEAQHTHDASVVDLLQQFERLERARLRVFVEQLSRFAALHDDTRKSIEGVAAQLHAQVNGVNIASDLQAYMSSHATGKPRPSHVEYQPCRSQIIDHAMDIKPSVAGSMPVANASFAAGAAAGGPPPPPMAGHQAGASGSFNQPPPPQSPVAAPPPLGVGAAPMPSIAPPPVVSSSGGSSGSMGGEFAVALYNFEKNEPDDLAFQAGETIQLLSCPEHEEWWQGQKDGQVGIFPKAYVAKQPSGGAGAMQPAASAAVPAPVSPPALVPPPAMDQPAAAAEPMPPMPSSNPFGDEGVNGVEGAGPASPYAAAPAEANGEPVGAMAVPGGEASPVAGAGGDQPKLMDATCTALFDFDGQDDDELSFKVGQQLVITGELNGWYLGRVQGAERTGIFPSNHVQIDQ